MTQKPEQRRRRPAVRLVAIVMVAGAWSLAAWLALECYARIKHYHFLSFKAHELTYRNADFTLRNVFIPGARGESVTTEWRVPYAINSWGLRDREYPPSKSPGTFRILAVGDSSVEGYGVRLEETFIKRFEDQLNRVGKNLSPPLTYEVVNGGMAGYSPLLEYLFLSSKGLQLQPDLVLLVYNASDLTDDYELEQMTTFDAAGKPLRCHPYKRVRVHGRHPVERFLSRHSRAFLYLEHKLNVFFYKRVHPYYVQGPEVDKFIIYRGSSEMLAALWQRNERYLGMIHELLQEHGIPLVLMTFPNAVEIDAREAAEWRVGEAFAIGQTLSQPSMFANLDRFASARGLAYVNVYEAVKAHRARVDVPLYFRRDPHPNAEGHRVIAEALFHQIEQDRALVTLFKIAPESGKSGIKAGIGESGDTQLISRQQP